MPLDRVYCLYNSVPIYEHRIYTFERVVESDICSIRLLALRIVSNDFRKKKKREKIEQLDELGARNANDHRFLSTRNENVREKRKRVQIV